MHVSLGRRVCVKIVDYHRTSPHPLQGNTSSASMGVSKYSSTTVAMAAKGGKGSR